MTAQPFDVVIVGAGLAGSALAVALGESELRVALIEAQTLAPGWPDLGDGVEGYDPRVVALTEASRHWLQTLHAWNDIESRRVCAYRHMRVWDGVGTGAIDFDAGTVNQPLLGHIAENRLVQAALMQRVRSSRVVLFNPARLESLQRTEAGVRVTLEDGRSLQASLLVGADGGRSRVRQWSGLATREWDYGHHALVATVACEKPHEATAWQRFMPEGPLAFLPLAGGDQHYCSIVWSTLSAQAEQLMALDEVHFCRRLTEAFEARLGRVTAASRRFSFPLQQMHAVDYCQPGLALIGDAAHTIHPLAGQGINLGLQDARVLAEEVLRAQRRRLPVGDIAVLGRYQRRRKGQNLLLMGAMEGFKRLFASRQTALLMGRNIGMSWLQRQEPLKRPLIRAAMGLDLI